MKRPRLIWLNAERSTRRPGVDSTRRRRAPEIDDTDRPKRIDYYIDYFGGGGVGATLPSRRIDARDRS